MPDLGHRLGLPQHPALQVVPRLDPRAHQLDRDLAIELGIVGRVHLSEPAAADRLQDDVAPRLHRLHRLVEDALEHATQHRLRRQGRPIVVGLRQAGPDVPRCVLDHHPHAYATSG